MKFAPSATMMPHSAAGGRTPRPMNDSPAAFSTAQPRLRDIWIIIGGNALGNTCTASVRRLELPDSRAACTKPASRRTLTSARATRA